MLHPGLCIRVLGQDLIKSMLHNTLHNCYILDQTMKLSVTTPTDSAMPSRYIILYYNILYYNKYYIMINNIL